MKNIKYKKYGVVLALCVGVGMLSFFGGQKYATVKIKKQANQNGGMQFTQEGGMRGVPARRTGTPVTGEVISADKKSITVKTTTGDSKIIFFSSATRVEQTVEQKTTDIAVGDEITVVGLSGSSGTFTATSIKRK